MSTDDLLKTAEQRQQEIQAIEVQKTKEKEEEHQKELAIEKEEFETLLRQCAGDILDRLDEVPVVEPRLHGITILRVNVFHRTLSLVVSDKPAHHNPAGTWKVCDTLRRQYWGVPKSQLSDKTEYVVGDKLSDYLLLRMLKISKEHDRLLVEIEKAKAEKSKQEAIEAKQQEANERLRLFDEVLQVASKQNDDRLQLKIETANAAQWTWPKDFVLNLYKVMWCTGACRDEYQETEFDYDSGWSLTDVPVSEVEYFVLLPERGRSARTVKTSGSITVERIRVTEATLSDLLFDYPATVDIDTVDIDFNLDNFRHRYRLLPDLVPPLPEGAEVSLDNRTPRFDLKRLPCLEIRRAIDEVLASSTPNKDVLDNIPY